MKKMTDEEISALPTLTRAERAGVPWRLWSAANMRKYIKYQKRYQKKYAKSACGIITRRAAVEQWTSKNRKNYLDIHRRWFEANRQKAYETNRAWRKNNPEQYKAACAAYRKRKREALEKKKTEQQ